MKSVLLTKEPTTNDCIKRYKSGGRRDQGMTRIGKGLNRFELFLELIAIFPGCKRFSGFEDRRLDPVTGAVGKVDFGSEHELSHLQAPCQNPVQVEQKQGEVDDLPPEECGGMSRSYLLLRPQ